MNSIHELLTQATQSLNQPSARLEAEVLLCHVLQKDRSWLFAWSDRTVDAKHSELFLQLLEQRIEGVPLAHLTGEREFWSLPLKITAATLIPRPDTELLVENVLALADQRKRLKLLDLGTGSGAIALALASERPDWQITASDYSEDALETAAENARRLGLNQINFTHSNWFENLHGRFDIIVSNPPYIAENDPHLGQGDLRFEPRSALASGPDGLDDIREITQNAAMHLLPDGWLLFEHGFQQGPAVRAILRTRNYNNIHTKQDLAHLDRVTSGTRPG